MAWKDAWSASLIVALLLHSITNHISAWQQCRDDSNSLCPDENLCCGDGESASGFGPPTFACLSGDRGSAAFSTCCDDGLTGCGKGFSCSTEHDSVKASMCVAIDPETDELPKMVPRTKLCSVSRNMTNVYGLPMMDYPLAQNQRGLRSQLPLHKIPVVAYLSSHGPLHENDAIFPLVQQVVLLVHGSRRNVEDYICCITGAVPADAKDAQSILLLAPWFLAPEDGPVEISLPLSKPSGSAPPLILRWTSHKQSQHSPQHTWRYGALSTLNIDEANGDGGYSNGRVSSFSVVDRLIRLHLNDARKFPALRQIVVTGHSAGGQFVQRWAMLSPAVPDKMATNKDALGRSSKDVPIRCVVANPKTFAYLDDRRWIANGNNGKRGNKEEQLIFRKPDASIADGSCPEYNEYLNGLYTKSDYTRRKVPYVTVAIAESGGVNRLIERYARRNIVYLSGDQDVIVNGDCAAMQQGPNRYTRSQRFFDSLQQVCSHRDGVHGKTGHVHRRWVVPNVHHDHCLMYQSVEGQRALFGGPEID